MDETDAFDNLCKVQAELNSYSASLAKRPCWLVLTKMDLIPADQRDMWVNKFKNRLQATALAESPLYAISAVERSGLQTLMGDLMSSLEEAQRNVAGDPKAELKEAEIQAAISADVLEHSQRLSAERKGRRAKRAGEQEGPEIIYRDE